MVPVAASHTITRSPIAITISLPSGLNAIDHTELLNSGDSGLGYLYLTISSLHSALLLIFKLNKAQF